MFLPHKTKGLNYLCKVISILGKNLVYILAIFTIIIIITHTFERNDSTKPKEMSHQGNNPFDGLDLEVRLAKMKN